MGRWEKAQEPEPSTGAAARKTGGRSPSPARTRTGPGRDATLYPRRRLIMTGYMDAFTGGKVDPGVSG